MKRILASLLLLLAVAGTAYAIAKKKHKTHFKLITAYTRSIPENEQTNPPMEGHFFIIKWQDTHYPETFFWRGEGGWFTCDISRISKDASGYSKIESGIGQIHRGDQLMLTPLTGGRFAIPPEIPQSAKNTLFYKVAGSKWLAFPVKNIKQK